MNDIIDIFFYIINTAVLIVFIAYLFRRFAQEPLQQAFVFEQLAHANLVKRQEQLRKQEQSLIRGYYHQNYVYEELSHKVDVWRRHMESNVAKKHAIDQAIGEQIRDRQHKQQEYAQLMHVCQHVSPQALEQAEKELIQYFATPEHRARYIHHALYFGPQEHA